MFPELHETFILRERVALEHRGAGRGVARYGRVYRDDIGVPERLVRVINNGIDTRRFAAGDGRALRAEWLDGAGRTHS